MIRRVLTGAVLMGAVFGSNVAHADPSQTLKMRTMAPVGSKWWTIFKEWKARFEEQSSCKMEWTPNGAGRDEAAMVADMNSGNLDGAAMTAVGLGKFVEDILVFQMPGLFSNWGELDAARNAERGYLDGKFKEKHVVVLGFGDVGASKIMGTSTKWDDEIWRPSNLAGKGLSSMPGDVNAPALYNAIGASFQPVGISEISSKLGSSLTALLTPPYAAFQLQWAPKVHYMLRGVTPWFAIGGLVVTEAKLNSLPDACRTALLETGKEHAQKLTNTIRNADASAYETLSKNLDQRKKEGFEAPCKNGERPPEGATCGVHEATAQEKQEWADVFRKARQAVKGKFSSDLVSRVCKDRC